MTRAQFYEHLRDTSIQFVEHQFIAHIQAECFDECIDNLPFGHLVILTDYSMNHSHEHQDQTAGEHWAKWQTTVLPLVCYLRVRDPVTGREVVWADAHTFMSPDLNHSNKMHQYSVEQVIEHYKTLFARAGHPLTHVHIWSDGCASQFKNRREFYWLTTGRQKYGIWLAHNFFQSCHGKGKSTSPHRRCRNWCRHGF